MLDGNAGQLLNQLIAVAISTVIGIFAGWAFGRRQMPGKELLMAVVLLPRMIPPITYALGIARIFYGLHLVNTHFGIALALWLVERKQPWLAGGALAGFAARMAGGCTSGQALTGGALLLDGSWVFTLTTFMGAYGAAWFVRRQWL